LVCECRRCMKRVLVIGATGFDGRPLVREAHSGRAERARHRAATSKKSSCPMPSPLIQGALRAAPTQALRSILASEEIIPGGAPPLLPKPSDCGSQASDRCYGHGA
jgi:hypothetical protein